MVWILKSCFVFGLRVANGDGDSFQGHSGIIINFGNIDFDKYSPIKSAIFTAIL